ERAPGAARRFGGRGVLPAHAGARRSLHGADGGAAPGHAAGRADRGDRAALLQPLRLLGPDARALLRDVLLLLLLRPRRPAAAEGAGVLRPAALRGRGRALPAPAPLAAGAGGAGGGGAAHQPRAGEPGLVRAAAVPALA